MQQGLITQDEFDAQKQKILGGPSPVPVAEFATAPDSSPGDSVGDPAPSTPRVAANDPGPSHSTKANGASPEEASKRLFQVARTLVKNGEKPKAVAILKKLIAEYPDTEAAAQARKSLTPRKKV